MDIYDRPAPVVDLNCKKWRSKSLQKENCLTECVSVDLPATVFDSN